MTMALKKVLGIYGLALFEPLNFIRCERRAQES